MFSCKKDADKYIFTGKIKNGNTGVTVDNANITLYAQTLESNSWNTTYNKIKSVSSSQEGIYRIEVDEFKASSFMIGIEKTNYIDASEIINPDNVKPNSEYYNDYIIYSEAIIKYHFYNSTPYDDNDILKYKIKNGTYDCSYCCGDTYNTLNGSSIDTVIICTISGSQNISIEYQIIKNGVMQLETKQYDIPAIDTVYIEYNY